MPQALPLMPQLASLDGRSVDSRPRPTESNGRAEHRQAFHRMLDRISRPDAAPDAPRDDVKEAVKDPLTDPAGDEPQERAADIDGGSARNERDPEATSAAADADPVAPDAVAALEVSVVVSAQSSPASPDAKPLAQPLIPADMAPLAATIVVEAALSGLPQAAADPARAAIAAAAAMAEQDAATVLPATAEDGKVDGSAAVPLPSPSAAMVQPNSRDAAAKATAAVAQDSFAAAAFQLDQQAEQAASESAVSTVQLRQDAKTKGGSAAGLADLAAPAAARDERAGDPLAVAFSPDSPKSAVALYNRVAEASRPAVETAAPADQVSMRLLHAVAEGKRAIQVHLHPAELGAIDVKMQWQDNKLTAQFVVDRPETLQLLQRDLPALERSLGQAGVNVDSGSLQFSLRQQQGQNQGQSGGQGFAPARSAGVGRAFPEAIQDQLGQVLREGILSIRV